MATGWAANALALSIDSSLQNEAARRASVADSSLFARQVWNILLVIGANKIQQIGVELDHLSLASLSTASCRPSDRPL